MVVQSPILMKKESLGYFVFCASLTVAGAFVKPLKVYILAGQSNMQGSAHQSTFAAIGDDAESAPLLKEILDESGEPVVCENAWVAYQTTNPHTLVFIWDRNLMMNSTLIGSPAHTTPWFKAI